MAHFAYDPFPAGKKVYQDQQIGEDHFHSWTKDNHFRTSYGTMYTAKPREPSNNAIPGYAGFIPGYKANGEFGRTYAVIAKESLSKPDLGFNKFGLSSTGFNLKKDALVDPSLTAWSHKYGAPTMQKNHPSIHSDTWISHTHERFKDPTKTIPPTYRPASIDSVNKKNNVALSGYSTNFLRFDGKGLFPKESQGVFEARTRTEYRVRFNTEKPYHLNTTQHVTRKVKPLTNTFNLSHKKHE